MENITIWHIYLYGIYDSVGALIVVAAMALGCIASILILVSAMESKTSSPLYTAYNMHKKLIYWFIAMSIISAIMPSKNIAIAMFALEPTKEAVKLVADSNRTKSIMDSIDNIIYYVDKKSKELTEDGK